MSTVGLLARLGLQMFGHLSLQNLDGGTPKITGQEPGVSKGNTFRVEDGMQTVGYDIYEQFDRQFGHLVSGTAFSHSVVAVEYRFQPRGRPCV